MKHLIRTLLLVGLAGGITSVNAIDKAALETRYKTYYQNAKAVVDMALTKKVDPAEVDKRVSAMVAEATWMAKEYAAAFPAGAKLLTTVVDNIPAMKKATFKELERTWHDLGYFSLPGNDPGIDLKSEDNEHFTDPIHAIVHPIMVLKAAELWSRSKNDNDLQSMKEEMEEGIEQAEKLKSALSK